MTAAVAIAVVLAFTGCAPSATIGSGLETPRAGAASGACLGTDIRTFGALEAELHRREASPGVTPDEMCRLAYLYWKAGRPHEAEGILESILETEPGRVDAALLLTRVYRQTARKAQADTLLARTARATPGDLHVRLLQAEAMEGEEAVRAFGAILEDHPESVDALLGSAKAGLDLARRAEAQARGELDRALQLDSMNAAARLLDADLENYEDQARRKVVDRALFVDSLSVEAHASLSELLRSEGDLRGAFDESLVVLRLDPYSAPVHRRLGNGGSLTSWGRYPPLPDEEVPPELAELLDEADAHLVRQDLAGAETVYRRALESYPGYAAALLGLAAVEYHRGEYERALEQFREVAVAYPDLGLAHFGVSQSLARIEDRDDPELREAEERFRETPRPPEPDGLRKVFPDFDRVDEDLQKVILLSVAPLSNYVGVLAAAGATYRLIPFHKRLWEIPNKERSRGRRTFDLRLWDDVKGQGGFHAAAGEEWVREAMYERFNVLAHEFMHQVHSMFTENQREEVEALFREAKRAGRTLDSYADYNEMEYLAQAYEAWISRRKLPGQGETAGHDRSEVERLDPDIVRFLETVNARPSYRGNEIVAFRQKIQTLAGEGDLEGAEAEARTALERYGEHPDLLSGLSGVLRLRGEYRQAMDVDRRSIRTSPEEIRGYRGLAEDLALGSHDYDGAADAMAEYLATNPASDEAWLDLAGYALAGGRYDEAEKALITADSLIGTPNPEGRYHSLKAELALIRGDTAAARAAHEYSLRNISRGNIAAWTDLAVMALRSGALEEAATDLETAQAINPSHPRVREVGALLLEAQGEGQAAVDRLVALHEEDPRRLETLTELIGLLGRIDPPRVEDYVEAGQRLMEAREPVEFRYEGDRYVAHGAVTVPSMARFEAAVRLLEGGGSPPAPVSAGSPESPISLRSAFFSASLG